MSIYDGSTLLAGREFQEVSLYSGTFSVAFLRGSSRNINWSGESTPSGITIHLTLTGDLDDFAFIEFEFEDALGNYEFGPAITTVTGLKAATSESARHIYGARGSSARQVLMEFAGTGNQRYLRVYTNSSRGISARLRSVTGYRIR